MEQLGLTVGKFVYPKMTLIYILGAIVVLAELWFLLTSVPRQVEELQTLQKSQTDISKEVNQLDRAVKILSSVDQNKLAAELSKVNAALPSQKKTSGLVAGLTKIASDSGIVVKEIDFAPGRISTDSAVTKDEIIPGSQVRRIGASLTMAGTMSKLTLFLSKIQTANQIIGINSVSFTGSGAVRQVSEVALQVFYEPISNKPIDWSAVRLVSPSEEAVLAKLTPTDVFTLPGEER